MTNTNNANKKKICLDKFFPVITRSSSNSEICMRNECVSHISNTKKRSKKATFELRHTNYPLLNSNHNQIIFWKNIFLNCNLKTIFMLRSVSQMFYHLSTRMHLNYSPMLLANRHISQENINISMTTLLHTSSIHAFFKNEVTLMITLAYELTTFLELANDNHNRTIIDKIKHLNLSQLDINETNFNLINSLFDINFPELTKLTIGDIVDCKFIFPETMSNLKSLSIGNIMNCHVDLPETMNELITLSIGNSYPKSYINFPISIENLQSLTIGDIKDTVVFVLSNACSKITTLTVGNVEIRSVLDLSLLEANKFKSIKIGAILSDATLILPTVLEDLEELTFGDLFWVTTCLPKALPNLRKLTLGNLRYNSQWHLSNGMINLQTLVIGDLSCKVWLELPMDCKNLLSLTIGKIGAYSHIKFPLQINGLATIKLGHISDDVNFEVSKSKIQILSLEFEETQNSDIKEMLSQVFLKK